MDYELINYVVLMRFKINILLFLYSVPVSQKSIDTTDGRITEVGGSIYRDNDRANITAPNPKKLSVNMEHETECALEFLEEHKKCAPFPVIVLWSSAASCDVVKNAFRHFYNITFTIL